jgi:membrane protease subunit (stomatin/prohibitin family)
MALVDVIKFQSPDDTIFVWKHPVENIKLGSQLVVNEGLQAIFAKGGQALDCFDPGKYTLSTGNLPLIDKLINLPFGGDTPFPAEVWFVSTTVKRDLKWGTPSAIPLMDPSLGFPVSARAFGKWGIRINNSRSFVSQIVGSQISATSEGIHSYFIGQIVQSLSQHLSRLVSSGQASVLNVATMLSTLSESASVEVSKLFAEYGLELVNFNIESINIPKDEMSQIQQVFAKTLEARELSKVQVGGAYNTIKSFEVLNNAASNESGGAMGAMIGAGIGIGVGLPIGGQMAQHMNVSGATSTDSTGENNPMEKIRKLKAMMDEGLITKEQFEKKRDQLLDDF